MSILKDAIIKDYKKKKLAISEDLEELEKIISDGNSEEAKRLIKDIRRNFTQLMKIAEPPSKIE